MQEAQYGASGVRALMRRIARARKPCLAIMNMPPLPYLKRIPGLDTEALDECYADAARLAGLRPRADHAGEPGRAGVPPARWSRRTCCRSACRPTSRRRASRPRSRPRCCASSRPTSSRRASGDGALEIPVKLKVHDSVFVPLAKWPMLIAGNYRCIRRDDMIAIREAVHGDVRESREIYEWVAGLCTRPRRGRAPTSCRSRSTQKRPTSLGKPSSAARALFAGAEHIERVDGLVRRIAAPARAVVRRAARDRRAGGRAPSRNRLAVLIRCAAPPKSGYSPPFCCATMQ